MEQQRINDIRLTTITVKVPCRIASFEETQPKHSTEHIGREVLAGEHIILAEDRKKTSRWG